MIDKKILAVISLLAGIANMTSMAFDSSWYLWLCFSLLGAGPIIFALLVFIRNNQASLRALSWANIIFGCSILSLAISDFYGQTSMPIIQYSVGFVLCIIGTIGLFDIIKQGELEIIP